MTNSISMRLASLNRRSRFALGAVSLLVATVITSQVCEAQEYKLAPHQSADFIDYQGLLAQTPKLTVIVEGPDISHRARLEEPMFRRTECQVSSGRLADIESGVAVLQRARLADPRNKDGGGEIKGELIFLHKDGAETVVTFGPGALGREAVFGNLNGRFFMARGTLMDEAAGLVRHIDSSKACAKF